MRPVAACLIEIYTSILISLTILKKHNAAGIKKENHNNKETCKMFILNGSVKCSLKRHFA